MAYEAKMLLDSISPDGVRLCTMQVTFPRIVLAEFNTHRVFSRNSASSRAIPFAKMLDRVMSDPFIPDEFGANQRGMQAAEPLSGSDHDSAVRSWIAACDNAVNRALILAELNVHKGLANRLIEPFMWHTVIITATEWGNFFALRCHPAAQREIRLIAEMMKELYDESQPQPVNYGEWHMPYVLAEEREKYNIETLKKMSVARCTRVSYMTHGTDHIDVEKDLALCDRLAGLGHMSPFEHVARPLDLRPGDLDLERCGGDSTRANPWQPGNFRGWHQMRKDLPHEDNYALAAE